MARLPRVELAGAHYHVTSRGVERRAIFRDDADCEKFVELLGWSATHFGWRVLAWVLMGNHYHLLLQTTQANLSRSMQRLNQLYSMAFNRRHRRVGTFFQGRFKAVILEWDEAGLAVSRYVHLNPVRVRRLGLSRRQREEHEHGPEAGRREDPQVVAARVDALRAYRWSSLRVYAGYESRPAWLDWSETLEALRHTGPRGVRDERKCRQAYVQWVEEAVREGEADRAWEQLKSGIALGTKIFVDRMRERLRASARGEGRPPARNRSGTVTLASIVAEIECTRGERVAEFRDRHGDDGRDLVLYLAREYTDLRLAELAKWAGGVSSSTVSMAIARITVKLRTNRPLARQLRAIEQELAQL